jgi:hypothetical protein
MCMCPLCHVIYHSYDEGSWRQSLLSTSRCCNVCGRNLITGLTSAASPSVDISSTCKVGQKLGVSLPLLTCSSSAWPSRLLYRRGWKSQRDLWITLYYILSGDLGLGLWNQKVLNSVSGCIKCQFYCWQTQTFTSTKDNIMMMWILLGHIKLYTLFQTGP